MQTKWSRKDVSGRVSSAQQNANNEEIQVMTKSGPRKDHKGQTSGINILIRVIVARSKKKNKKQKEKKKLIFTATQLRAKCNSITLPDQKHVISFFMNFTSSKIIKKLSILIQLDVISLH